MTKTTRNSFFSGNKNSILDVGAANPASDTVAVYSPPGPRIKSNVFKHRKIKSAKFHLCSFNCRTMSKDIHQYLMEQALSKIKYDVIGLSELKRDGEEIIEGNSFILYFNGSTKNSCSVGFLVNKKWKDQISEFIGISERVAVLILTINGISYGFTTVYAPTADKSDQVIEKFYDEVAKALKLTEKCNFFYLLGDWNSKIGKYSENDSDVMGKFGIGDRNERGQRLIDFARSSQLFISNTMFKKRRKVTWELGRAHNEIDFILIRNDQKFKILNYEVIHKFEYSSDHHLIRATVALNTKIKKKKYIQKTHFTVINDPIKTKNFKEGLNTINLLNDELTMQQKYDKLIRNVTEAASVFKSKSSKPEIITTATKAVITERENLRKIQSQSTEISLKYKAKRKEANRLIKRDVRIHQVKLLEQAIDDNKSTKNIKNGICKNKNWIPKLRDEKGIMRTSQSEIIEIATKFYQELFSSKLSINDYNNLMPEIKHHR